jgi:NhaP-type Na+/H+ or K+/H+ antiporter
MAQRGSRGIALLIVDLVARRGWVVNTTPRPLYPREIPGTHCTGGWVGPRAVWTCAKILAPPRFDPRTVQPVASRYTG